MLESEIKKFSFHLGRAACPRRVISCPIVAPVSPVAAFVGDPLVLVMVVAPWVVAWGFFTGSSVPTVLDQRGQWEPLSCPPHISEMLEQVTWRGCGLPTTPGSVQGQLGWGLGRPGIVEGVPW